MKHHTTTKARILAVEVPEGAREFKVFNDEKPYLSLFDGYTTPRIYLPKGNWIKIGFSHKLTEEQCREIVDTKDIMRHTYYKDYTDNSVFCFSAKQSFASLNIPPNILILYEPKDRSSKH